MKIFSFNCWKFSLPHAKIIYLTKLFLTPIVGFISVTHYLILRDKKNYFYLNFLGLISLIICQGCGSEPDISTAKKFNIVTTTGILGDAVKNIVGDSAGVISLMGPGVDPHLYKASHGDLRKLIQAHMIVFNGLHLEGKMGEVFRRLSNQKHVTAASDGLQKNQLRYSKEFNGNADPHIWFDVKQWRQAISYVGQKIILADTIHAGYYRKNLNRYLSGLDTLDNWVRSEINKIPKKNRVLITAHDAFGYFGDAYHIEVRGLQGISTMSDYGLNDITALVKYISDRKIKAIFVESSVSGKSIEAVIEGCTSKGHSVIIGGTLYSDALGANGTYEGTYVGMIAHNVATIVKSLK